MKLHHSRLTVEWLLHYLCCVSYMVLITSAFQPSTTKAPPSSSSFTSIQPRPSSSSLMAVWSDAKAVREYQDFLSSGKQEIELLPDAPSVIVLPSKDEAFMNSWLVQALQASTHGGADLVVTPDETLPTEWGGQTEFPIYVCLHTPALLQTFLATLNESFQQKTDDFVFFSGGLEYGNVEDTLKTYGMCRDATTQVLLGGFEYLPVTSGIRDLSVSLGTDAMGATKWAGETAVCGKWKGAFGQRLQSNTQGNDGKVVRCQMDFYRDWRRKMWERHILDAIFLLVGAVREERTTIAQVSEFYEAEVGDMVWEVSQQLRGWKAMTLLYGFEERMHGIAQARGAEGVCTLYDQVFPQVWGNQVFTESPIVLEYLWYAKENCNLLQTIELPKKRGDDDVVKSNIMRKGVLRADGVV